MIRKFGQQIISPFQLIIRDSRSLGIILSLCAIVSIIISNSSWAAEYSGFWLTEIHFPDSLQLPHTLVHWINDFLMSVFFFMVGMEIKRELLEGELADIKKAIMPIFGAIGGMVVPAVLYFMVTKKTHFTHGWGIPMATDIAFSLGIASLLGSRVPLSLKIFLTALAIIDDLGAIGMIAIFYGGDIQWTYLIGGVFIVALLYKLWKWNTRFPIVQYVLGFVLWYCIYNSGIHATVAGVFFAFTVPLNRLSETEHRLHVPVNFLILPIFALANTVIALPADILTALMHPVNLGITIGLALGKPLGITMFCYLLVTLKFGMLPEDINWRQVIGVGMLAGIGFTMSIFIATLAFGDSETQDIAKIGVLIGTLVSIISGSLMMIFFSKSLTSNK